MSKTLIITPRILNEDQIAAALRKQAWVSNAKVVRGVDSGDANQDIPVCYIEVTFTGGKTCRIQKVLGSYAIEALPRAYSSRMGACMHEILTA
jgi:hypothetical protein